MTNNRGILYDTAECLSSAVRDFYKVIPFLENPDNKSITFRDFTQSISNMRHSFLDYEDLVMRACYMINDEWNHIENNSARLYEVSLFLNKYEEFKESIIRFDDCCQKYESNVAEYMDDNVLAMEYYTLLGRLDKQLRFINSHVRECEYTVARQSSPYKGLSDALCHYMYGLSDSMLEDILIRREFPIMKATWTGRKNDATYFGHHFGLECQEMNRIFNFHGESGKYIKLHYKRYHDGNIKMSDGIAMILSDYPSVI